MARIGYIDAYNRARSIPPNYVPQVWGNKALRMLRKIHREAHLPEDLQNEVDLLLKDISDRPWLKDHGLAD
jgi:outer membrane protein assembly factor BamD (BamD/ComL family)